MIRRIVLALRLTGDLMRYVRARHAWHLAPALLLLGFASLLVPMERRWVQRPIVYAIF